MTRKLRAVIPAILCVALAASACSKKEETPTFTGDKTEEPSYQANLDFVTPAAYSNIQGLNLEPGTYISIIGKDENSSYWKEVKKGVSCSAPTDGVTFFEVVFPNKRRSLSACTFNACMERSSGVF